ncbi:MAG: hypothetical protein ACYTA5_21125 [Planctomycetota bacterium]
MSNQQISEKQLQANRQNAKKSTGPKTPEGKARSSQNALKHGLLARQILINDDDPPQTRPPGPSDPNQRRRSQRKNRGLRPAPQRPRRRAPARRTNPKPLRPTHCRLLLAAPTGLPIRGPIPHQTT